MKMRVKKMLGVAAALTAMLGLAACGNDEGTNGNAQPEVSTEQSENQPFAGETLVFWVDEGQVAGVEDAIASFEAYHDVNIVIEERAFAGQLEDLTLDGPAGIGADVVSVPSDQIPMAVLQGLLLELNLDSSVTGIFSEGALDSQIAEGGLFGLPYAVETQLLFYNRDLISSEDLPQSFDEWYDVSQGFVEDGQFGLLALLDQIYYTYGIMAQYGGYIFGRDGVDYDVTDIGLNNEGSLAAMEYLTRFYGSGTFPAGIIGPSGISVLDGLFEEGMAAAVISGPWNLSRFADAGIDFGVAPLPMLGNGERMASFFGVKGYSVSSFATNTELATLFVTYLTNYENSLVRYEKTGEVPALAGSGSDSDVAKAMNVQMEALVHMPRIAAMNEVWSIDERLQTIASGAATPQEALDEAVSIISQQITANH